ncbi:MAG: hypothetical protein ACQESR_15710 [Planctomycetota bacterium]
MESCPTQAVLPLVGLAAEKVIRDRYIPLLGNRDTIRKRPWDTPLWSFVPQVAPRGCVGSDRVEQISRLGKRDASQRRS